MINNETIEKLILNQPADIMDLDEVDSGKQPAVVIRPLETDEVPILKELLYEAIFIPEGVEPPPYDIIKKPEVDIYIRDFGNKKDDLCLLAVVNDKIAGGVWIRILADEIKGFGNIDPETPEFSISLFKEYRNRGIGTVLMRQMIDLMRNKGYKQTSLSVNKANYAVRMYKKVGFEIIRENEHDYIMVLKFPERR
jgi:ribosomal protein S18 acetylase RimI-like enzyme